MLLECRVAAVSKHTEIARMRSSGLVIMILAAICWQPAVSRDRIPTIEDLQPINILTPTTVSFLKGIPNLFDLCGAIKSIPHGIVIQIKEFLEEIVEEIPEHNLLKFHFNNVIFLISSYENIINAKKDLVRKFRKAIDDLEPNTDEPTMFRDVTEAITNPFKPFLKPFELDFDDNPFPSLLSLSKVPPKKKKPIKLTQL